MIVKPAQSIAVIKKTLKSLLLINPSAQVSSFKQSSFLSFERNRTKRLVVTHASLASTLAYPITTHKFTESLIESLHEYIRGSEMLEKGQYAVAITQFELALKFLPKTVTGDNSQTYQAEYESLVKKLLEAHLMINKPVISFIETYKEYLSQSTPLSELISVLLKLQANDFQSLQTQEPPKKLWQELVRAFAFRQSKQCFGKHVPIERVKETKDLSLKYVGLFLYEKIRARKNKERESIYLDTCRELLKQTEQYEPSKIVKPLSLMACNLLAGDQFLQAQGLMCHCLSALEQFYHQNPMYLKTNQEYIMCKLLLARVFEGVKRGEESRKIKEEWEPLFDERRLFMQELVQLPYREL